MYIFGGYIYIYTRAFKCKDFCFFFRRAVIANHWAQGGYGAKDLAAAVESVCEEGKADFKLLYPVSEYVYIYICIYTYMYICVCVQMYVYVYVCAQREREREREREGKGSCGGCGEYVRGGYG